MYRVEVVEGVLAAEDCRTREEILRTEKINIGRFVNMRRVTRYCCTVWSACVLLQGQQDPKVLVARVRERVLATVDRLPNYMCTQTIDRAQYEPVKIIQTSSCTWNLGSDGGEKD